MIVIDKSKTSQNQNIILTLTELTTIVNAKYLMVLKNDAIRTVTNMFLPENISTSKDRYDLFQIATSEFYDLVSGFYTYSIYQQSPDTTITDAKLLGNSIEDGKLLIKDLVVNEVIAPADNNDYIIYYKGDNE